MNKVLLLLHMARICFSFQTNDIDLEYDASLASRGIFSECPLGQCKILGNLPSDENSPSPLFIWVPCTGGHARDKIPQFFIQEMSQRGYVAVSFDYPDPDQNINLLEEKAATMFDASNENSPLSIMCGRDDVDCSMGIAVAGYSQGTHLALLSATVDSRVSGVYTIEGARVTWPSGSGSTMCDNENIAPHLPQNRRRYILGEGDQYYAWEPIDGSDGYKPSLEDAIKNNKILSGYDCGENRDCIQPDGSGYFVTTTEDCVPDARTACPLFGVPNHTNWAGGKKQDDPVIAPWFDANSSWGVTASLDWLASVARN